MNNLIDQFKQAIAAAGLTPPTEIVGDGVIYRFSTNGKPSHKNGCYILHTDGIAAGAFGDWREGFSQNWSSKADTAMTEAERLADRERVKTMQRQRVDATWHNASNWQRHPAPKAMMFLSGGLHAKRSELAMI